MKKKLLSFLFLFYVFNNLQANTCTTTAGTFASWAALTWTCTLVPTSGPPGCGDVMNIAAGTTVNVSADVDYSGCSSPIDIHIYGTMNFNVNGVRFKLPPGSQVYVESGGKITKTFPGGGSSTLISIGGVNVWTAGDGTITGPTVLPIELLSFKATPSSHSVFVDWSTATEINNDFYNIEKSTDGINFSVIGTVDGAGNSTSVLSYSFEDLYPTEGVRYYRLRQTDFNGLSNTFQVVDVAFHKESDFDFTIAPNPNTGEHIEMIINAEKDENLELLIVDITGRPVYNRSIVMEKQGAFRYSLDFEQSVLSPGMYMVSISSGKNLHVAKMLVD